MEINKAYKVGWIGTGVMGKSMASLLFKLNQAGNGQSIELVVYNRTKSKTDDLVAKGAKLAESPKALAAEVDFIFLMLGYPKDVESMVFDPEVGIKDSMKPGTVLIDHTSSSPELA